MEVVGSGLFSTGKFEILPADGLISLFNVFDSGIKLCHCEELARRSNPAIARERESDMDCFACEGSQ
ncbi:MAG: hypothetical protein A3G00_01220 [Candidatus Magasanikbacteria bacterium RIFCSPLOWO2_12_FULL_43_12]|uniref:Uncharacterized protein n=1 Tax=Candidatus Magasanikbacteria bacterium RIFCSPLOWO2_12_FULL_43_12 TaxID=1798692 RepID=A0A1F6MUZ7_9BACT|nr:MAG: hypothetical protein A3I93_02615 [Candidatus Magasanikbacteria bacterium RIFCSPLOWO2_02_FULL_43_22]OGH75505.1 MAG: hypothetical protein A3G00_01220 [Candidatus Magasanikbacteria bacterium RIFCSPLOWO2_12_FULL_43_12]